MQENLLFDEQPLEEPFDKEIDPVHFAQCVKSAVDKRLSCLEKVVEKLSEEVVYLRGRLSSLDYSNDVVDRAQRLYKCSCDLSKDLGGSVQPWEDPPKVTVWQMRPFHPHMHT